MPHGQQNQMSANQKRELKGWDTDPSHNQVVGRFQLECKSHHRSEDGLKPSREDPVDMSAGFPKPDLIDGKTGTGTGTGNINGKHGCVGCCRSQDP